MNLVIPKKKLLPRSFFSFFFLFFFMACYILITPILAMESLTDDISLQNSSLEKPTPGGRIRLGILAEPATLIPYLSTDATSHDIGGLLYVAPLEYDKDLQIVPVGAKSYEVLNGGRLLRFVMRDDIYWQDGVQLTTDDIEFTYKLMVDPKTPTAYAEDFLIISKFEKTGKFTFDVHYEKPFARALMTWMGAILPKHILENQDITTTSFARNPIGAGPFKLKSWDSGVRIVLEASETYFKGRPNFNEVVYSIIPDTSTMFLELRAGHLDMMSLTPQQYLKQTIGPQWEKNWKKYRYLSFSYTFLGFNLNNPMFQDVLTRQGISHAIDRTAIVDNVLLGQGIAAFGPYKPGTWVYNTTMQPIPYNIQKAKELLSQAGWKLSEKGILQRDGIPFSFTILVNQGNEQRIRVANIVQSQLKDIGIDVQIRIVEWAAFLKEFIDKGNFEAVILAWSITQDPDIFEIWHSSKAHSGGLNFNRYKNAEVDELLIKAREETDSSKRKPLYDKIQELLHYDQPYCFLYVPYSLPIVQKKIHGIKPAPAGIMYNFEEWWIPKELQ